MRFTGLILVAVALALSGCGGEDPVQEIEALVAAGDIVEAKKQYQALVEKEDNPNIERRYLEFLFEQKQYQDFRLRSKTYLDRYPEDLVIKELYFDFYAMLATNAERQGDYEVALDYIVSKLLSSEYKDFRKWETRQSTVLTKWFTEAKEKDDKIEMLDALIKMKNLGFENLARSLDPDLYKEVEEMAKTREAE